MSLFNYTMRKVWLQQTRIGLSLYDYTGQGFLRETVCYSILGHNFCVASIVCVLYIFPKQDLESYILELIPTLPQLEGLEKSFHSFYVCTAVRKFFFFLDPLRTGKIRIRDVLACSFLEDLLEVCILPHQNLSIFILNDFIVFIAARRGNAKGCTGNELVFSTIGTFNLRSLP